MEIVGEYVDRLVTIEIRPRNVPLRGLIRPLYDKAREKCGGRPLTLLAAEKIIAAVKQNDNVIIITGAGNIPFFPNGETDGPLGAASLARAVSYGLEAKPIFVTGEPNIDSLRVTVKAAGINVDEYDIVRQVRHTASIIPFPLDEDEAKQAAKEIFDTYNPKAIFAVEAIGPNQKGVIHGAFGLAFPPLAKLQYLFNEAKQRDILTIGCIDVGNEIGSGTIVEEVRKITRYGDVCICPCGGGIACVTEADVTLPAACSNWGAYGIAAMLASLLKKPDVLHDVDTERRMLEACIMAGAVDGLTMKPAMSVDGMSDKAGQGLVAILQMMVENSLREGEYKRET